ncbi:uncharacterized protein TNIN_398291 [Trichonephila inaurata madagascariensis]|uniref:Uncharacterized protein n=1 Tax=Trichonephila inaurata madagascariensis TaxID=2747483 RepID=A0A8X6YDT3_9ARAC|nr:uncharacterized protein TNIN_398291 [Trichonephila inaurata madagascariensis]
MEVQLRNLVKRSNCEVMEAQLRNEESVPLIPGIENENNASDDTSDQEKASMQLVLVRHELYIDTIGPLPIAPTRDKHILPDMSMSPRCHETVTVPETTSTPLVETLLQIFRWVSPREIQADRGGLLMSILTSELFQKLGKPCPAQLKVKAIIDFSISRYKTQVKVLGFEEYYRQYIPMFFCLVTPVTETLKRKSKKGDIKWTSECPEFFRQLEENLSSHSVLYAPDFMKRFIYQPETIFVYLFSFVCRA